MVAGESAGEELAIEEVGTNAVGHALDLTEWFAEDLVEAEVAGRDDGIVLFEFTLVMFQLFEIGFGWDRVTDGHDVVPFVVGGNFAIHHF